MLAQAQERLRQLALGEVVADRYRVLGFLGTGGMGEVYEVEHLELGRHFALKLLREEFASDPETAKRFTREARAMAVIESEFVIEIVDFGRIRDSRPYLVMQRLRGRDLREHLAECAPLPIAQAVDIIIDACSGLQAVHAAGLVHRDLKPANLFVTQPINGRQRCVLLDFGVVKSVTADSTQQGSFVGTIRYMAPEQILEHGIVGPWTDIYSLGTILYECLTAQVPFVGDAVERVLFKILNEGPQPLEELRDDIPLDLRSTLDRALSREPDERFHSAADFASALAPHANLPTSIARQDMGNDQTLAVAEPPRRPFNRQARTDRILVATLVMAAGLLGWLLAGNKSRLVELEALRSSAHPSASLPAPTPVAHPSPSESLQVAAPLLFASAAPGEAPPRRLPDRLSRAREPKHVTKPEYSLPRVDTENPYAK